MFFHNEIIKSIKNLFDSNINTDDISKGSGVAYDEILGLRNNEKDIYSISVETCMALYNFAVVNKLNQKVLDLKNRKGIYNEVDLQLPIDKIVVSFNNQDLFALGKMIISNAEEEFTKDKLVHLRLANSVFEAESGKLYDTYEFGEKFNCNYGGSGPNALVGFIEKYSSIDINQLRNVIFNNEIVIYDFKNDKITGEKINNDLSGIKLNKYNAKLIVTLDNYSNIEVIDKNLEDSVVEIELVNKILYDKYNKDTSLISISYIYEYNGDTIKYCDSETITIDSTKYRIILEYNDHEIWIPYFINEKDAIFSSEFNKFIEQLGVALKYNTKDYILKKLLNKASNKDTILLE